MLKLARRSSPRPEAQGLLPVRPASALLGEHGASLTRIFALTGVPEKHWRLLYEALFGAYAEYVQQIPTGSSVDDAASGTILRQALETVERSLKVRRGYLLPPGKEPEAVAEEQDVWTYAVVVAALLNGTGEALLECRVTLHDRAGRAIGGWVPWIGPMSQSGSAYYHVEFRPGGATGLVQSALPLFIPHIVPGDGLRWLAVHEDALDACLRSFAGLGSRASVIREIVSRASKPTGRTDSSAESRPLSEDAVRSDSSDTAHAGNSMRQSLVTPPEPKTTVSEHEGKDSDNAADDPKAPEPAVASSNGDATDPGEAFLEWLTHGITSGVLSVNAPKGHLHVVDAGLLLASPAVFRAFAGDNWREVQKRFLKRRLTEKAPNGENIFHYRSQGVPGRETIKGLLIRNPQEKLGIDLPVADPQIMPKQN